MLRMIVQIITHARRNCWGEFEPETQLREEVTLNTKRDWEYEPLLYCEMRKYIISGYCTVRDLEALAPTIRNALEFGIEKGIETFSTNPIETTYVYKAAHDEDCTYYFTFPTDSIKPYDYNPYK